MRYISRQAEPADKRWQIDPHHTVAILYSKRSWTGAKIAKMGNGNCCVPLCYNDKRHHSGKDLSNFNFPRDKQKRKSMPPLEW